MTLYVAFVSVLNLCIGYVLGAYLGVLPGCSRTAAAAVQKSQLSAQRHNRHTGNGSDAKPPAGAELLNTVAVAPEPHERPRSAIDNQHADDRAHPPSSAPPDLRAMASIDSRSETGSNEVLLTAEDLMTVVNDAPKTDDRLPAKRPAQRKEADEDSATTNQDTAAIEPTDVSEAPGSPVMDDDECDPQTKLRTRASAERTISRFCQHSAQSGSLSVALVEIDDGAALSETYGSTVSDRLLSGVARLVDALLSAEHSAARFSSQQLLLILTGESIESAASHADELRQQVDNTKFIADGKELTITVSCGVAAANAGGCSETLFERMEESLGEAKRYGCNRTFWHDGSFPTPVVPPEFALRLEERVI